MRQPSSDLSKEGFPLSVSAVSGFIETAFVRFANEIWNITPHEDGFIIPACPYELRSALNDVEQRRLLWFEHELEFPWGLEEHALISMSWDAAGPGLGSEWCVHVLRLPSERRIYVETSDWRVEPQVLSVSDQHSTTP